MHRNNNPLALHLSRKTLQEFVTSSGTTDGLETYDFDYFTNWVIISPVFASTGETVSISEVNVKTAHDQLIERVCSFVKISHVAESKQQAGLKVAPRSVVNEFGLYMAGSQQQYLFRRYS